MLLLGAGLAYYLSGLLFWNRIKGYSTERGFHYRRKFTGFTHRVLGVRVSRIGIPVDSIALYVSNHRSLLDPFVQLHEINACVVSKAEVAHYPLIGAGARVTGVIFVARQQGESRHAAKEAIRDSLMRGLSVLIYPEGTTSDVETSQPFKLGSFSMAAAASVPIVPVAIEYRNREHHWEQIGTIKFFMRKFGGKHLYVTVRIGTAIHGSDPELLLESAQSWIDAEILRIRQNWLD